MTNQIVANSGSYTTKLWHGRARVHLQSTERNQRIAGPLKGDRLPSGTLCILLQDNGQVAVHHAINETQACSTKPGGSGTVGVDKGYTEAYTDNDGERHGEGLGALLAQESDTRKVKGQRHNKLRDLEGKHRAKGHTRKADNIRQHSWATGSGTGGGPGTTDRCATISARRPMPSWTRPASLPARICPCPCNPPSTATRTPTAACTAGSRP